MADKSLVGVVQDLSDLELAILLCLINREHCLISTPSQALGDLVDELQLVSRGTFGLQSVVIECSRSMTLDDFASALFLSQASCHQAPVGASSRAQTDSYFSFAPLVGPSPATAALSSFAAQPLAAAPQMANVVLAKNLDRAPHAVQIQALELLRTHRIFTRTAVQVTPKQFVFVPLLGAATGGAARVTSHLNDLFFVAHWHDPRDGYVYLEQETAQAPSQGPPRVREGEGRAECEADGDEEDETASTRSVVKKTSGSGALVPEALLTETDVGRLLKASQQVDVEVDVIRYQMNIVSFLRMHRAVSGGISPVATKHFLQLSRSLAVLHGLDFVTPSLVRLAVRKAYLHRIQITEPYRERSMQWGSELRAVESLLQGMGPEQVMQDVLQQVTAPI